MNIGRFEFFDPPGAFSSTLNQCTLFDNSATFGGGALYGTLNFCSLARNRASSSGGGAGGAGTASAGWGLTTLNYCVLYFNNAPAGANYGLQSKLHNCCTTPLPESGVGNIAGDPAFRSLAAGDLHLLPNSPCIDAVLNGEDAPNGDPDGHLRPLDGNRDGVYASDIGAYEFDPRTNSPTLTEIHLNLGSLSLVWNSAANGMKLQHTTNLTNPNWQDVPNPLSGKTISIPFGSTSGFFRLVTPPTKP